MIAASSELNWFVLLVIAIFGIIKWVAGRLQSDDTNQPAPPSSPGQSRRAPTDSEEERMRRFLEALGIPADASPPQSSPHVQTARPPAPPMAAAPIPTGGPKSRRKRSAPPPPLPSAPREVSLDELGEPRLPVERIELPELAVATVAEFETVTSRVGAMPAERAATGSAIAGLASPLSEIVRRDLASPQQLRSAFVLREILGPPRGLQS